MDLKDCKVGLYEKALPQSLGWKEKIAEAKSAGYDFIEISIDETDEKMARVKSGSKEGKEIRRALLEAEFSIFTMCLSGNRRFPIGSMDQNTRETGLALIRDAVDFAAMTGIRIVQLAGYDEYYGPRSKETERLFLEGLRASVKYAACRAVTLAIENVDTDFMNTLAKIKEYVDEIRSPWLKIYADIANLTACGVTVQELYEDIGRAYADTIAWHVKDGRLNVIRDTPYGEGIVDFDAFFAYLKKREYAGLFVLEMWSDGAEESVGYIKTARQFLSEKIRTANEENEPALRRTK